MVIRRILSGIQPSGVPHLGNYLGALKVSGHADLAWILQCVTNTGWLNKMTQYKTKKGSDSGASSALFTYPVLQCADILLYRATHVPVGEDQVQHIELARDICQAFNTHHQCELFDLPNVILQSDSARIMNLRSPKKKMSKSDVAGRNGVIELTDDADTILKKIKKATTDSIEGISYDPEGRPGVANLLSIAAAIEGKSVVQIAGEHANSQHSAFKQYVAETVIEEITPIGASIKSILQHDRSAVEEQLADGEARAALIAKVTLEDVKKEIGLA